MKIKLIYLILLFAIFLNCSSEDDSFKKVIYWDQTACADPWKTNANDSSNKVSIALKKYLEEKDIKVFNINFEDVSTGMLNCNACHCTTGLRIWINIPDKDIDKILQLDFKRV